MTDHIIRSITSRAGITELGVLLLALLVSWLVATLVRRRLPQTLSPGFAKFSAGSVHRIVWPLLLLALTFMARTLLVKYQPTPILQIAIPLIAAFAGIRLTVYLLRHLMAPSAVLKASERFIVFGVWVLVALHITGALGEISDSLADITFAMGKQKVSLLLVLQAIASAAITIFLALGLSSLIEGRVMKADTVDISSRVVITKFVRALALVLAVLIALPLVGIDLTLLSVFGGALGVGLGFGLQKIASNYVSGFIILLDRSIKLGDLVTVDNKHGVVEAIKSRYTVIKSGDGTEAIVPNDTLISSTVVNHSYTDSRVSVKTVLTIRYGTDIALAKAILLASVTDEPRVLAEPPPAVAVKALVERGIELELIVWIADAENGHGQLRSDILTRILQDYAKAAICFAGADPPSAAIAIAPETLPADPNTKI
jgi:small-conductance mechanosensitive channel